ncbi:PqqD family peptide modification chaperone [Gymnodinialimonas ceratoperidinii]|uniref:PqqD family peptide modification chaperone n=1 Tax=Gymnodinialimonas ceratoperidinii TaxID=2856823 RepID=A0A8F6TVH0_9RHOB|nr:PqqD family protein [Gymnodinialimonas ceratoperidinii]QXT38929.1 PqqD family peptide modification chaperone [Gymnodinialimonas ceratoperidinii]
MTDTTYLHFDNLDHPVALTGAQALKPLISKILAQWPHRETPDTAIPPFASIKPTATGQARGPWALSTRDAPAVERQWDDVNVVCDLVSEMAWELIRSNPSLLCLHAAAVDFGGSLVVMPNARRAGKSTLCAALSRLGHSLFTDDFLPVRYEAETSAYHGIANGVAPRVRLPLPAAFSPAFRDWVASDGGPANAQYKYLVESDVAPGGTAHPLGAMVVLTRSEEPCAMSLAPMAREDALSTLITQNFARQRHAATILNSADKITERLPIFRLTYHSGEAAAAFLSAHPALQQLQAVRHGAPLDDLRQAPLDPAEPPPTTTRPAFDPSAAYAQCAGVVETTVGEDHFLADHTGRTINRLNPGSAIIWRLLAEPSTLAEIVELVRALFDEADPAQVRSDSERAMRDLFEASLITCHDTPEPSPTRA